MSSKRRLRKDTIDFLEVKEQLGLPLRVLPQGVDVLCLMLGRKRKKEAVNIDFPVSCPRIPGTFELKCSTSDGCRVKSDPTEWCVVRQIIERYEQAAIPHRSSKKIGEKCHALFKLYWDDIRKHKEYTGDKIVQKREDFIKNHLQALFPAYHDKVEIEIRADKKRSKEKQDEDIAFFKDQMSVRDMALDARDIQFDKEVRLETEKMERKQKREEAAKKREEAEALRKRESMVRVSWADLDAVVGEGNNNSPAQQPDNLKEDDQDEDYIPPDEKEQKTKRFQGQTLFIPSNIISLIVHETSRLGLTDGQLVGTVAIILKVCGGELENFAISHSTARRQREIVNSKVAVDIMIKWVKMVKELGLKIILHYDGKLVEELQRNKVKRLKFDRLSVIVRIPEIDGPESEQLLGIPEIKNGKGITQTKAIFELLDHYGIRDNVVGLCQDTTSANVGNKQGVTVCSGKECDKLLLRIDCRRHVTELFMKHFASAISGRETTAPGDIVFKRHRSKFDTIRERIDYDNLNTFEWPQEDSFMYRKAMEVLMLVQRMLDTNTFTRGDYKELAVLVYIYLSGNTEIRGQRFQFSLPHNISHARFMQRALNYITLELLDNQADYMNYTPGERREVKLLAQFSALFYTPMFLQSSLAAEAPYLDIKNIQDMRQLVRVCQEEVDVDRDEDEENNRVKLEAAKSALSNVYFHPDYLTPSNIVMALAGDMMSVEDKSIMARAIWEALQAAGGRVASFPFKAEYYKKLDICALWPEEEEKPDLRRFIGHDSLLIFHLIGQGDSICLSWLTLEPSEWTRDPGYEIFRRFVKGMDVVNDVAER